MWGQVGSLRRDMCCLVLGRVFREGDGRGLTAGCLVGSLIEDTRGGVDGVVTIACWDFQKHVG